MSGRIHSNHRLIIFMVSFGSINLYTSRLKAQNSMSNINSTSSGFIDKTMTAKAYKSTQKKTMVYTEIHKAIYKGGKIFKSENKYFDISGKLFAELVSDYTINQYLPTYWFKDLRTNYKEGLRYSNGKYIIFNQNPGNPEETEILENTEHLFSGQGWHYYLSSNIRNLEKKPLNMRLLFPSRLDDYEFRIRITEQNSETVSLRLEFSSWIIRMFAPHLDLLYQKNSGKLLSFYGPSNIADREGNTQNVYIEYD